MERVKILGSGYALADTVVTNQQLQNRVDTSDEWIVQRTGIHQRYISEERNTSDLGYAAALSAIEKAGIDKENIKAILVATMTPDCITPSTACLIQEKLGLNHCQMMCFDINSACSGFLYAFQVACSLLDRFDSILVIGSETMSKLLDWNDRSTCVLFGDGAGAMILSKGNSSVYHYANSMGDHEGVLRAEGLPLVHDLTNSPLQTHYLQMKGNDVFRFAVKVLKESIEKVLEQSSLTIDDIDCIIPHQANLRIIQHVAKKMNIEISRFYINLDEFGNTSAASIAIAYAQAIQKGVIDHKSRVIMVGFGAGLTYGATLIDGGQNDVK